MSEEFPIRFFIYLGLHPMSISGLCDQVLMEEINEAFKKKKMFCIHFNDHDMYIDFAKVTHIKYIRNRVKKNES